MGLRDYGTTGDALRGCLIHANPYGPGFLLLTTAKWALRMMATQCTYSRTEEMPPALTATLIHSSLTHCSLCVLPSLPKQTARLLCSVSLLPWRPALRPASWLSLMCLLPPPMATAGAAAAAAALRRGACVRRDPSAHPWSSSRLRPPPRAAVACSFCALRHLSALALRSHFRASFSPSLPVWYSQALLSMCDDPGGRAHLIRGLSLPGECDPRVCRSQVEERAATGGTAEMLLSMQMRNVAECRRGIRTEAWLRRHYEEGDWQYSPEWWGTQGGGWGRDAGDTVFESLSAMGNGVISVTSHLASTPRPEEWTTIERELQQKRVQLGRRGHGLGQFKVVGFEWRVLRFNSVTRQSVAKVMVVSSDKNPSEVFLVQQPNCIAFEYVKSMLSVGLTTMSLAGNNLEQVINGSRDMRILCIGLGGGSLPLYLAHNLRGATLDVVEIDGAVIDAAVESMGFPPCKIHRPQSKLSSHISVQAPKHEMENHVHSHPSTEYADGGKGHDGSQEVLWESTLRRMTVYEADGEAFVENLGRTESNKERSTRQYYDLIFLDAFDGEDVVPTKLWQRDGAFLTSLSQLLHPKHGTVVVNLHTDAPPPSILEKATGHYGPGFDPSLPQGRKIQEACWTYRDALLCPSTGTSPSGGMAFTVAVPSQGNISLVASRGLAVHSTHIESRPQNQHHTREKQMFIEKMKAESKYVQKVLNIQLDFSKRVSRGFQVVHERMRPSKVR